MDFRCEKGSEMETRRGSSNRSLSPRKNRLIPERVFRKIFPTIPSDIGGEGHPSNALEDLSEVSPGTKPDGPESFGTLQNLTGQVRMEINEGSSRESLGPLDQAVPDLLVGRYRLDVFCQENFNPPPGLFPPKEFGFDHPGIVDNEYISWEDLLDDFIE